AGPPPGKIKRGGTAARPGATPVPAPPKSRRRGGGAPSTGGGGGPGLIPPADRGAMPDQSQPSRKIVSRRVTFPDPRRVLGNDLRRGRFPAPQLVLRSGADHRPARASALGITRAAGRASPRTSVGSRRQ